MYGPNENKRLSAADLNDSHLGRHFTFHIPGDSMGVNGILVKAHNMKKPGSSREYVYDKSVYALECENGVYVLSPVDYTA